MPNLTGATQLFPKAYENTVPMTLGGSVVAGAATVPVNGMTNYTDGDVIAFVVDGGTPALKQVFTGVKSGSNIINAIWTEFPTGGVNVPHSAGASVIDYVTATHWDLVQKGLLTGFNPTGGLLSSAVQTALNIGSGSLNGFLPLGFTFNSVTYNGNRSYTGVINGQDVTNTLSSGMRIRTTRTVAAPVQCSTFNGTTQFWSKTSPAGMTFTNNFVAGGWIKLSAYPNPTAGIVISRFNGTSGWYLYITSAGQLSLTGVNAGAANTSAIISVDSLPLNEWVHVAAQLDMASFSVSPTTSYIMIDGQDAPAAVSRAGTNPTALVQAGDLNVGAYNGGTFPFAGKIAQAFVTNAKVTEATIQADYYGQSISPTETSLISAYSFGGNANDLNTTNANNLTSNNAVAATTADSPFGGQAGGTINSTLDYGIVETATFSTNSTIVFQAPEGCTVPTLGGVASIAYSSNKSPYGMPSQRKKWWLRRIIFNSTLQSSPTTNTWYNLASLINLPIGEWMASYKVGIQATTSSPNLQVQFNLSTSTTAESDPTYRTGGLYAQGGVTSQNVAIPLSNANIPISNAAATIYYGIARTLTASTGLLIFDTSDNPATITYDNAYL